MGGRSLAEHCRPRLSSSLRQRGFLWRQRETEVNLIAFSLSLSLALFLSLSGVDHLHLHMMCLLSCAGSNSHWLRNQENTIKGCSYCPSAERQEEQIVYVSPVPMPQTPLFLLLIHPNATPNAQVIKPNPCIYGDPN